MSSSFLDGNYVLRFEKEKSYIMDTATKIRFRPILIHSLIRAVYLFGYEILLSKNKEALVIIDCTRVRASRTRGRVNVI